MTQHGDDRLDLFEQAERAPENEAHPALRVLRLGRSHVSGAAAGLVAVAAIASGVLTVGASEGAPPSTAPAVSTSAPTTPPPTATGEAGMPGLPGLDAVTAARLVAEALADSSLATSTPSATRISSMPVSGVVPKRMLAAYQRGEKVAAARHSRCNLPWWLLAGIGRVESGHAAGGAVDAEGVTVTRILGPRLDGTTPGTATIADTDGGRLDGDARFDRAVGPMQFIPGTWAGARLDGNGDGTTDPNQVDDAAASAAGYLCSAGGDMTKPADMAAAILRYNNSQQYVEDVLAGAIAYRDGVVPITPPRRIDGVPEKPARARGGATAGSTSAGRPSGDAAPTASAPRSIPTTGSATSSRAATPRTPGTTSAPTPATTPTTGGPRDPKAPTASPTATPSLPLPSCRPPSPSETGEPTPTATKPTKPTKPTTEPTQTGTPTASPDPTHTWDPDDPRIAHLPVCETVEVSSAASEPVSQTATSAGATSSATGHARATAIE